MSIIPNRQQRRIDDALSQLVDTALPSLQIREPGIEEAAETEEERRRRHNKYLSRVQRILLEASTTHNNNNNDDPASSENINNVSDLIKRKLYRGAGASPDKAVRFSNLYTRLLTQPVLSQKWAILYLLYRLSSSDDDDDPEERVEDGVRSRSPLLDENGLQYMTFRGRSRIDDDHGDYDYDDDDGEKEENDTPGGRVGTSKRASMKPVAERDGREENVDYSPSSTLHHPRGRVREKKHVVAEKEMPSSPPLNEQHKRPPPPPPPPESTLLRDLPYNLQGISSSNLKFSSEPSTLSLPPTLPIPIISVLHTLAEPCLLYKGLASFVEASSSSDGGLIMQSLRAAVANELRSYLGLVATLEVETRRALIANEPNAAARGGVTLRRFVAWTRDATMALRLMSLIVEEAQSELGFSSSSSASSLFAKRFAQIFR